MKCYIKYIFIILSVTGVLTSCDLSELNIPENENSELVETLIEVDTEEFLNADIIKDNSDNLRAGVVLSNLWVVQFDSISKQCNAVYFTESFDTGERLLNPTLLTGTNKIIYVIANGPSAGTITTSTYTLDSFRNSGLFSGQITDESKIPYIGQVPGMVTVNASGKISNAWSVKLTRISARVGLNLFFNIDGFTLESVKMYNKPLSMYYLNGWSTTVFPAVPSVSNISSTPVDADVIPADLNNGQYLWFTGENKRGTNNAITTYTDKDIDHTPSGSAYCTYIRIVARKISSNTYYTYDLFLGTNETTDFNLKRNWYYNYSVTLQGNEIVQDYWDSVDGRIKKSTETANCYFLQPLKSITIPVNIKGNGNTQTIESGINVNHTATSMAIEWQSKDNLITLSDFNATNQTVKITATNQTGNAVIAAYYGTTIVWSWHIWVTDYNPNSTGRVYTFTNSNNTTNIFMDRDLGALNGLYNSTNVDVLYYQFGRKDPLMIVFNNVFQESGKFSMEYSIRHPQTFFHSTSDWCSTVSNEWWVGVGGNTTTPGSKTIYDPCPSGWRVPVFTNNVSPWQGATKNDLLNGMFQLSNLGNYMKNGYYKANIYGANQILVYEKNNISMSWTANSYLTTTDRSNALYLSNLTAVGDVNSNIVRSNALTIRCVKE